MRFKTAIFATILLLFCIFAAILLPSWISNSTAQQNPTSQCSSSSCGSVSISFPFRLKGDPESCGYPNPSFELGCQNNHTIFSVNSKIFYVQDINYSNFSVRLVDPGLYGDNLSSCPDFSIDDDDDFPSIIFDDFLYWNIPVAFIYCLAPIRSLKYVKAPLCGNGSDIFLNSSDVYSYVMIGPVGDGVLASDLEESCGVNMITHASFKGAGIDGYSLNSIYGGLAYGFEFSWSSVVCDKCMKGQESCSFEGNTTRCTPYCSEGVILSALGFGSCATNLLVSLVLVTVVPYFFLRFVLGFLFLMKLVVHEWRRRHLSADESIEDFLRDQNNATTIKYAYSEIKKMTNNFTHRLGEGGYGTVYKGKLRSGPYVAVKMMAQSMASEQEFISEVRTIGRIHHVNIVQLIGFCIEGTKCGLVYDFLPNGSLDRYIFNQEMGESLLLEYGKMFDIALGVARGIEYLHQGCEMQILHFDIKPYNILLDENFNPKISDFGLAKLHPIGADSVINLTAARGTIGYMAPEMFYKNIGGVSYKADVYSFGMLMMEMAGRRKNLNPFAEDMSQIYFPSWIYDQIHAGKEMEIKDVTEEQRRMVKKIMLVALWCIQMKPCDRPSMNKVVEMLENDAELKMPPRPFMAVQKDQECL
ncbi:rust resistance kinase Lr10-like isoform X2 [Henckelia pumila]|uniref:rust resistance kinase Lr10-like isoform X2 n=1 Tax=Henckelia pumila TaxID=405737 RepID=UPI003C6DD439